MTRRDWTLSGTRTGRSRQTVPSPRVSEVELPQRLETGLGAAFDVPVRFEGLTPAERGRLRDGTPIAQIPIMEIREIRPAGPRLAGDQHHAPIADDIPLSELAMPPSLAREMVRRMFEAQTFAELRVTRGTARYTGDYYPPEKEFDFTKVFHKITNLIVVENVVWDNSEPKSEPFSEVLLPPDVKKIPIIGEPPRGRADARRSRGSPDSVGRADARRRAGSPDSVMRAYATSSDGSLLHFTPFGTINILAGPRVTDKPRSGPWPERTPHGPARQREKKQRHARNYKIGLAKQSGL